MSRIPAFAPSIPCAPAPGTTVPMHLMGFYLSFHGDPSPFSFQYPKQHIWRPNFDRHMVCDRKMDDLTALHVEERG